MEFYDEELKKLKQSGNFRIIHNIDYKEGKYICVSGRRMINFSSNDYLNLSTDEALRDEFTEKCRFDKEFLFSSASARLLTGTSSIYTRLENNMSRLFNKEACLLFNTGYQCNLGTVSALVSKGDVIFSDKLNHASIIAGMQLSGADFFRYKHLNYEHLEEFLKNKRQNYKKALIISESIFSMDGDSADIQKLVELKKKYNCMLMIDEAHAIGVFGNNLAGVSDGMEDIDIITAPMGKAFASIGACCLSSKPIIDYLINKAGSFIFSTALPSVNVMWTNFLIEEKFDFMKKKAEKLRKLIAAANNYTGLKAGTQIIPVIIGGSGKTAETAELLQRKGFYVLPLRPPAVPEGTSRLRLSLAADIEFDEFKTLIDTVKEARNGA